MSRQVRDMALRDGRRDCADEILLIPTWEVTSRYHYDPLLGDITLQQFAFGLNDARNEEATW